MTNYSHMYKEFSDQRLAELSKNVYICLNDRSNAAGLDRGVLVTKGMYATEELKNRGYENTVQDLIAEIAEEEGLFING